jgi:hypothetical protein
MDEPLTEEKAREMVAEKRRAVEPPRADRDPLSAILARIKRDSDKLPKWFKDSLGRKFDVR